MATAARWTLYSIATLVAYIMLITAANTASAAPAKGEIRALIKDIVYEAYPQCVVNKRQTEGDDMWCYDRFSVHLDDELNALYKDVMAKFRLFDVKQSMIRDVQRKWIKYRDQECLYVDSTDGTISDTPCVLENIGLSIHYLTRLKQIQFDKDGLQEIDRVIAEYNASVS